MLFFKDGVHYTEDEIRALDPSLPWTIPFSPAGYEPVFIPLRPEVSDLQVVNPAVSEINALTGVRTLVWQVSDKFHDYLDSNNVLVTKASQEQALLSEKFNAYRDDLQRILAVSVQKYLDDFARNRGYDNIVSACSYEASQVPRFAQDAVDAINGRDAVWVHCGQFLEEVLTGVRPVPTSEEFLATLPVLSWTIT